MNFGFLIFDDAEELDFVGVWEVIAAWSARFGGVEKYFTVSETGGTIKCAKGLRVLSDYDFAACPPLDYMVIPGGQGTRREMRNEILLDFVRAQATRCKQIVSVCTGSLVLHAAGLLNDKQATTHWSVLPTLRELKPPARVTEKRWTRDGNVWTAAGVSAGIDLALALVAEEAGADIAGQVQLYIEYYPDSTRYGTAHRTEPLAPKYLKEELGA